MRPPLARTGGVLLAGTVLVAQTVPPSIQDSLRLTVVLIAGMVLVAFNTWVYYRGQGGRPLAVLFFLGLVFALGFIRAGGPYSQAKMAGILFGFWLAFAALGLLRDERARRAMLTAMAVVGLASAAALRMWGTVSPLSDRKTLEGLSPIGVGFACALGAMLLFLAAISPGVTVAGRALLLASTLLCGVSAASTGSRGPLTAAAFAALVTLLSSGGRGRVARLVIAAGAVTAAVMLLRSSTAAYAERLTEASSSNRVDLWRQCLEAAWNGSPTQWLLGTGWGDMTEVVRLPMLFFVLAGDRQYEHNLFLEALVEGGLLAFLGLLLVVVRCWRVVRGGASDATGQAVLAVYTFAIATASVSGDLAGNRLVWVMLGCALAAEIGVTGRRRTSQSPSPSETPLTSRTR